MIKLDNNIYPEYPYAGIDKEIVIIPRAFPAQYQDIQPGLEYKMNPVPIFENPNYIPSGKLNNKVVVISGGDSGIGRAISVLFAKEEANIIINYLNEEKDALFTKKVVESYNRRCILIEGDLRQEETSKLIAKTACENFGRVDVLINNCGVQFVQNSILDITKEQLVNTFETNIFSYFYLTKEILPLMKENATIINTTSITAFEGKKNLIDYSSTKGAVVAFTKSLALSLADQKIRVNAIAPRTSLDTINSSILQ